MPIDIQNRISHMIDTSVDKRMPPVTTLIDNKIEALLAMQTASAKENDQTSGGIGIRRTEAGQATISIAENCGENARL
jgi:hypothetical protein